MMLTNYLNQILIGDNRELSKQLPDQSVQTIVTSPPYWGLRDYGVVGQMGAERTPEEYVANLVDLFRELRRALRDDGTLWLNLGDSYNGSGGAGGDYNEGGLKEGQPRYAGRNAKTLKPKDLVGIPWRVAFALQADGWYLRSDIIWHKPNPMPESVTDRPTKSHEYIFLLSKSAQYYYDYQAILEQANYDGRKDTMFKGADKYANGFAPTGTSQQTMAKQGHERWQIDEDGDRVRNKRTVWTVPTKPFSGAHFATFPPKLIEPCILAGCPSQTCPQCGAPWERITEKGERVQAHWKGTKQEHAIAAKGKHGATSVIETGSYQTYKTVGFQPTCECGLTESVPGVVLDPFMGAGTVATVCKLLKRNYVGFELNPEYVNSIALDRIDGTPTPLFVTA